MCSDQMIRKKFRQSQQVENIYNKGQFECPKLLHLTTFETLKYQQQTMFSN
jgi:hypothetical protein